MARYAMHEKLRQIICGLYYNATDWIGWSDCFPEKAKPEMAQGVAFFNRMRDLTATGFFTSKIGIADLGYAGNTPNQWDGIPQDVLDQYGLKYDERTLNESVKFDVR